MIPERKVLRAAYDAVIAEIDAARGTSQLTTAFYAKVGDAIFEACYRALENRNQASPILQVVPAPVGSGKTTFTLALIAAHVRLACCSPRTTGHGQGVPRAAMNSRGERYPRAFCG
jgi:formyltetrahydrofolate synthetase